MNRVKKGVFLVRKGSYTTFNIVKTQKMWEKKGKIRKTWSMTKKKVIRDFCRENANFKFFRKKTSFRNLGRRKILIFSSPKLGAWSPPLGILNESVLLNCSVHRCSVLLALLSFAWRTKSIKCLL